MCSGHEMFIVLIASCTFAPHAQLGGPARVYQQTALSMDVGIADVVGPLAATGAVVLLSPRLPFMASSNELQDRIQQAVSTTAPAFREVQSEERELSPEEEAARTASAGSRKRAMNFLAVEGTMSPPMTLRRSCSEVAAQAGVVEGEGGRRPVSQDAAAAR